MVKPLGRRVLLKECGKVVKEVGGIVLPDSVRERQQSQSEVVALGSAVDKHFDVAVGDIVILVNGFSGTDVECSGQKYKIVGQEEILAVLEK